MQPGRRGSYGRMQQVAMAGLVLLGYKYMRFNLKNEFELPFGQKHTMAALRSLGMFL